MTYNNLWLPIAILVAMLTIQASVMLPSIMVH
jgi:hypothetical protein